MTIHQLCDQISSTLESLKGQTGELLAQFDALDSQVRGMSQNPNENGIFHAWRATQPAREALTAFFLDELHTFLGVAPPKRELYYLEGRRRLVGPEVGPLAARILGPIATVEARIARVQARRNLHTSAKTSKAGEPGA